MKNIPALFSLFFIIFTGGPIGYAAAVRDGQVEAELFSETTTIQPGTPFQLAIRLKMDPGWHTYWKNPGDSGLATSVRWELPAEITAGEWQWPVPERIAAPPLVSYGYTGEVFFLIPMTPSPKLPLGQTVSLTAMVSWLGCDVGCVPGSVKLTLQLPVREGSPVMDETRRSDFQTARAALATGPPAGWRIAATDTGTGILLRLRGRALKNTPLSEVYFFPDRDDILTHAAAQALTRQKNGYDLSLPRSPLFPEPLPRLTGTFVATETQAGGQCVRRAITINVPLRKPSGSFSFWLAILFAFFGGMILNLMPCVLPVISLKVFSFVNEAGPGRIKPWQNGLIFTAGILLSFWLLAAVLLGLRAAGQQIGWGFQFQSPAFLAFLCGLFFLLALSMFGIFEFTPPAAAFRIFSGKTGWISVFLNGILATVVATPCTAPFMGTALGFALTQPIGISFAVFTALGLGLALPYLLLSCIPGLTRFIPKPGNWTIRFKQFLGFFLLGSVVWLLWVLGIQRGVDSLISVLAGLLVGSISVWLYGIGQTAVPGPAGLIRGIIAALLFLGAGLLIGHGARMSPPPAAPETISPTHTTDGIAWQRYSPELLSRLLEKKQPVFIDFSAAWCLTCQVNERVALTAPAVVNFFKEHNITALKADWTTKDETITRALAQFGKSSIPLYVFYPGREPNTPVILPELITPAIVLHAIDAV